jgi:hypothetical protein
VLRGGCVVHCIAQEAQLPELCRDNVVRARLECVAKESKAPVPRMRVVRHHVWQSPPVCVCVCVCMCVCVCVCVCRAQCHARQSRMGMCMCVIEMTEFVDDACLKQFKEYVSP